MPELPEVQTTVLGINKTSRGKTIAAVSTTYKSEFYKGKDEIKNPLFFKEFRKRVTGKKILKAERRAKNVLIHLSGGETILTHMKMTGSYLYNPPVDAKHVRLVLMFTDKTRLCLADLRRFAKVTVIKTERLGDSLHLRGLGPEPLASSFDYPAFKARLLTRPKGKIKQVLMDPAVVAGIGNIYSDEILWRAGIHPLSIVAKIPEANLKLAFKAAKETLAKGIRFGGDSTSDYVNIEGKPGAFQAHHRAYQLTKKPCLKRGCQGVIARLPVGGRTAHFCPVHQKLYA
jgi:formamidopyrimidine-DNA glycosylase